MVQISVARDSSFGQAIIAGGNFARNRFLVLKDEDGSVLWSGILHQWHTDTVVLEARFKLTEEHIADNAAMHGQVAEFKALREMRDAAEEAGIL